MMFDFLQDQKITEASHTIENLRKSLLDLQVIVVRTERLQNCHSVKLCYKFRAIVN